MFDEIRSLTRKPQQQQAEALLKKLASQVKPIMKKRSWRVKKLSEFYPTNPHLLGLNVNRTLEIKIRLRPSVNPDSFLDWNDLIGTMLHELCHIGKIHGKGLKRVHGPHDAKFYKLLDQLFTEYEQLVDGGYQGEGFEGVGHVLGARNLPPHLARKKALEQAEKRHNLSKIMIPTGGRTVGSSGVGGIWGLGMSAKELEQTCTPSQLAGIAAERRFQDEKRCGQTMPTDSQSDEYTVYIHSSSCSDSISASSPLLSQAKNLGTPASSSTECTLPLKRSIQDVDEDPVEVISIKKPSHWTCPLCSLVNHSTALVCHACCFIYEANDGWACVHCTFINDSQSTVCELCLKKPS